MHWKWVGCRNSRRRRECSTVHRTCRVILGLPCKPHIDVLGTLYSLWPRSRGVRYAIPSWIQYFIDIFSKFHYRCQYFQKGPYRYQYFSIWHKYIEHPSTQVIVWFLYCSHTCFHWESQGRGWCSYTLRPRNFSILELYTWILVSRCKVEVWREGLQLGCSH